MLPRRLRKSEQQVQAQPRLIKRGRHGVILEIRHAVVDEAPSHGMNRWQAPMRNSNKKMAPQAGPLLNLG